MLILFLGRSVEGILKGARAAFPSEEEILIVSRNSDILQPPAGITTIAVAQFRPQPAVKYTVIGNGGTTAQLVPVLKALVEQEALFEVFDLQQDGITRLRERSPERATPEVRNDSGVL